VKKVKVLARATRSASDSHEDMLEEVVHEEVREVDFLVEDIAEEIRGLHGLTNSSIMGCAESTNSILCNQSVVEEPSTWVTSRNTIKHQIQQLRAQLNELKQIRKYLKLKGPVMMEQKPKMHVKSGSSLPVMEPEAEVCFCNAEKNKEARKQQQREEREEKRREKKLEMLFRKERKHKKLKQKMRRKSSKNDHCKSDIKMNCFR
jgi:hypothetical protein